MAENEQVGGAACPTERELSGLPQWALVALAARSAMRVLPAAGVCGYFAVWGDKDAGYQHVEAIEAVIMAAVVASVEGSFPSNRRRTTRGHGGSLRLPCRALASLTLCRFIPALSVRHRMFMFSSSPKSSGRTVLMMCPECPHPIEPLPVPASAAPPSPVPPRPQAALGRPSLLHAVAR